MQYNPENIAKKDNQSGLIAYKQFKYEILD